eukprot:3780704-Rhodomonas_salina.1
MSQLPPSPPNSIFPLSRIACPPDATARPAPFSPLLFPSRPQSDPDALMVMRFGVCRYEIVEPRCRELGVSSFSRFCDVIFVYCNSKHLTLTDLKVLSLLFVVSRMPCFVRVAYLTR